MEATIVFPESTCRKCDGELTFCRLVDCNGNKHVRIWCAPCYALWPSSVTKAMREEYGITDMELLPRYQTKIERGLVDLEKMERRKKQKEERKQHFAEKRKKQNKAKEGRAWLESVTVWKSAEQKSADIERLRKMPYRDYLKTNHWENTRKRALEAAWYRCQVCNAGAKLQVHHRTYKRRGNEHPNDLIVLCDTCHQIFHDNGKLAKDY